MNRTLMLLSMVLLATASVLAQTPGLPPGQQQRFNARLNQIVDRSDETQTNNFQLELSIVREGKTAR